MGTESEWCETRVENWLHKHYEDVQRDRNHFPDFRVGKDLAVEVTALKTLGPDGTTSTDTLEKRVYQILEGMLEGKGIPFHTSYGRCHIVVEYNLQEAPSKRVLVRQARRALARYAEPGQPIYAKPFIDLECGVRLGLVQVQHQTQSERGLVPRIGIEMSYEGCIPGVEVRRAIVDAIERKTPKAIEWKETHPDCKCWLALVSRIPDMYFKESFQEEVKDWQNSITVPKVWQRVLLWPFANTEEPKGEITNEKGEPLGFSGECFS